MAVLASFTYLTSTDCSNLVLFIAKAFKVEYMYPDFLLIYTVLYVTLSYDTFKGISQLMAPSFAAFITAQLQVCVSCCQGSLLPAMSREETNLKSLKGPLFCQRAPKGSQF